MQLPVIRRVSAGTALAVFGVLASASASANADSTSGVDVALFRTAFDDGGIFALEGARLAPSRQLSWKVATSYARSPLDVAVPGIGDGAGDLATDSVLRHLFIVEMALAMSLGERFAVGFNAGAYRVTTDAGFGERGRFLPQGSTPSTGLVALRPLSNLDPSGGFAPDSLAGPLDVRGAAKLAIYRGERLAVTAVGVVSLPFGEEEMLLGDRSLTFEPKLAFDLRLHGWRTLRLLANVAARVRQRTVLESYDAQDATATAADAKVMLDVGSEAVVGAGGRMQLAPWLGLGAEAILFWPLPESASWGDCRRTSGGRCEDLMATDYWGDATRGDRTMLATLGVDARVGSHVTASIQGGAGFFGARGDDVRVSVGFTWIPGPKVVVADKSQDADSDGIRDGDDACPQSAEDDDGFDDGDGCPDPDNDDDGVRDADDGCPNEPEDRDGVEELDGCPDFDNDDDGIADVDDRCPDKAEDADGHEDADGCPDPDNDGDQILDANDKCPNDPERANGIADGDGCPESQDTSPTEKADHIDLHGDRIDFVAQRSVLTSNAKQVLSRVAVLVKDRGLRLRVEVSVPLGTRSTKPRIVAAQKRKDRALAQQRANAVIDYLYVRGVAVGRLTAVGIGADRPLAGFSPVDPANDRVELIKAGASE